MQGGLAPPANYPHAQSFSGTFNLGPVRSALAAFLFELFPGGSAALAHRPCALKRQLGGSLSGKLFSELS